MRFLSIYFALFSLVACNQSAPQSHQKTANPGAHTLLQFSKAAAVTELKDANSWCNRPYPESVMIGAQPDDTNRRYFMLGDGLHRVVVQGRNMSSLFFVKKASDGKTAEVFTSDNFPMCLSDRANFTMNPDGNLFNYDNRRGIQYTVEAQTGDGAIAVFIKFEPGVQYGLTVHRCSDCR